MHASETKLRQLIEGQKQYVVPLFQRPYSWSEKQWKAMWNDVVEQSRHDDGRPHFFGSIVTAPARSVPQGVGKYLLIDGQQRITSAQLLLAAIRDAAKRFGNDKLHDRINGQYLANAYEEGDEQLKLLPTQDDRAAFRAVMRKETIPGGRLGGCYRFFQSRVDRVDPDKLEAIHTAVVDRLSLVSITCDDQDNPHLIFESLNAKGEKLTAADLIRNYLLMRVHIGDQDRLFNLYWLPIQQALANDLTEFVRHYLMKEGKILKEADVYLELKDQLSNETPARAESFLKDLHRHGMFYAKFINPTRETDGEIARRLDRVSRLKVTVAYPFLLRLFDAYDKKSLDHEQVLESLDILESFVIRRSICNLPTNQLRRMLPPVFDAAGGAGPGFVEGLRTQMGGRRCPNDAAFSSAIASEEVYSTAEKNKRLRLILERLEQSFNHKEPADISQATIEHVLPQTLTEAWETELGDGFQEHWLRLLHTIGNLTLTGYNAEMSNQPFGVKRASLVASHFELNRSLAEVPRWNAEAILSRGHELAQRAVTIWEDVGRTAESVAQERRANHPPMAVRFGNARQPVTNWKEAFLQLLKLFEERHPGLLSRMAMGKLLPAVIATDADRFRRSNAKIGNICINTHASAATLQDWCRKIALIAKIDTADFEFLTQADIPPKAAAVPLFE